MTIRKIVFDFAGLLFLGIVFVVAPNIVHNNDNGPADKTSMHLLSIATILDAYKTKQGQFPTDSEGLPGQQDRWAQ